MVLLIILRSSRGLMGSFQRGPFVPLPEEIIDLEGVVKKELFCRTAARVQWVGRTCIER